MYLWFSEFEYYILVFEYICTKFKKILMMPISSSRIYKMFLIIQKTLSFLYFQFLHYQLYSLTILIVIKFWSEYGLPLILYRKTSINKYILALLSETNRIFPCGQQQVILILEKCPNLPSLLCLKPNVLNRLFKT